MKHNLFRSAAVVAVVLMGSIGVQAAWVYDQAAGTLSDGDYTFKVTLLTGNKAITDPSTNEKVEGFQITGLATAGEGETVDFTDVKAGAGYDMIAFGDEMRLLNTTPCKHVVAPHVLKLGRATFYQNTNITSIVISDRVTAFPYYNFCGMSNLETITPTEFPYVETMTDTFPFRLSSKLTGDFSFPKLTIIGNGAFQGTAITGFSAPKLKKIDDNYGPFQGCSSLTGDLQFAELDYIGLGAFRQTAITSLVAPAVTNVGAYAFMNCMGITNIQLAANVASYGNSAFQSCQNLKTFSPMPIVLSNLSNTYDKNGAIQNLPDAFKSCNKLVGTIEISATEELMLTASWMQDCKALTNVTIRAEVTNVANNVMMNIGPGVAIYWNAEKAPLVFGANAFCSNDKENRSRIYVKSDFEGWLKLGRAITDTDKARADYPGKKAIGVINDNVYLVDGRGGFCIRIQ